MKNFLRKACLLTLTSLGLFANSAFAQEGKAKEEQAYKITVKLNNYDNDTCILGYRFGKNTFVKDTLFNKNKKGEFVFTGDKPLDGGIYLILTKPTNNFFEFIIPNKEEQKDLFLQTDYVAKGDLAKNLKIKGSKDNLAFREYVKFLADLRVKAMDMQADMKKAEDAGNKEKSEKIKSELDGMNDVVKKFQKDFINGHKGYLSANLIAASIDPEVPKEFQKDREKAYRYYKKHFWDNFDWSDGRLIRTPVFKERVKTYIERLTVQSPDSIIVSVDYILDNVLKGGDKEFFKYAAAEFLNEYAKSKVICMDAVYVHVGEKYYCSGQAEWVEEEQLKKICENVAALKPLRCGEYAPNIKLKNMDGKSVQLYEIRKPFTVVYFWDPGCGNCTKNTKKLVPIYDKYKEHVEVFGVCSKNWKDVEACKKKINETKMSWLNTSDEPYPLAVAKKQYDLKMNPYMVLLDKDKKIMYKRIDPSQLGDIIDRHLKQEAEKEKK